ncbi:MAG: DUF1707 domain-containing protein [Arachnia sp.]
MSEQLRPSFEERDKYLDLLSSAYADGRIDDVELEKRTQAVLAAVTHKDAIAQFEGLPQPTVLPPAAPAPPALELPEPQPVASRYTIEPLPQRFVEQPVARSNEMSRRSLGILGFAAVGVIGVVGFANVMSAASPPDFPTGTAVESFWEEPDGDFTLEISADRLSDVQSRLDDENLTSIASLRVTETSVDGSATSERSPGELSTFSQEGMDSVVVTGPEARDVQHTVELDELLAMLDIAVSGALAEGAPTQAKLVWTTGGEPEIEVTVDDGDVTKVARFDRDGQLTSLEEK